MMRFPTVAATRAAAFVVTKNAASNSYSVSRALRFTGLRAMSAAAPGPKVCPSFTSPIHHGDVNSHHDSKFASFLTINQFCMP